MVTVSGETKKESSNIDSVNFIFDNEVEDRTDDTLPAISYKDDIDTIQHFNNIIDHNILIGKTSLLLQGEDSNFIHSQCKARSSQFDQY